MHNHGKFPNKTLIEIISVYLNFSHNFTNIIRKQTTGFQHDIQYLSQEWNVKLWNVDTSKLG